MREPRKDFCQEKNPPFFAGQPHVDVFYVWYKTIALVPNNNENSNNALTAVIPNKIVKVVDFKRCLISLLQGWVVYGAELDFKTTQ